jgi:hypothetical protein
VHTDELAPGTLEWRPADEWCSQLARFEFAKPVVRMLQAEAAGLTAEAK